MDIRVMILTFLLSTIINSSSSKLLIYQLYILTYGTFLFDNIFVTKVLRTPCPRSISELADKRLVILDPGSDIDNPIIVFIVTDIYLLNAGIDDQALAHGA